MHNADMNNVAKIRAARGLTQVQLAELVGVRQPHISRIEKGDEGPGVEVFRRIADALKVELWELFAEETTAAERIVLDVFRKLPPERQAGWLDLARSVLNQPESDQQTA